MQMMLALQRRTEESNNPPVHRTGKRSRQSSAKRPLQLYGGGPALQFRSKSQMAAPEDYHRRHSGVLQAQLTINQSGDLYEQEADRVADHIISMPDQSPHLQRKF